MGVQYIAEVRLRPPWLGIAQVGRPDINRCGAGVEDSQTTYVQDLLTQTPEIAQSAPGKAFALSSVEIPVLISIIFPSF